MKSLIKNYTYFNITYLAESMSTYDDNILYIARNVFDDEQTPYFHSKCSTAKQWWQVVFSSPVSIEKYFIKTILSFTWRPKSWIVNASLDNITWKTVDVKSGKETGDNTEIFDLYPSVFCKYFRLIFLETNNNEQNCIAFTHFDCFGRLYRYRNICSCNRRKEISHLYILLYIFLMS